MKNFIYLWVVALLGFATVGCDPLEDINEELEANAPEFDNDGNAVPYTLTEDDYSDLQLDQNYFNDEDEARALIPALLEQQFPILGDGSLVEVSFMVNDTLEPTFYTVVDADYAGAGLDNYFPNFSSVQNFLEDEFSQSLEGDLVTLTYKLQRENIEYSLTSEDYDLIEDELASKYPDPADNAGRFSSFEIRDSRSTYWSDAMIVEALGVVLSSKDFGDVEGQIYNVSYATYDGSSGAGDKLIQFDGNAYSEVVIELGTEYTLVNPDDYYFIASELEETYPDQVFSLNEYENFERRPSDDSYWSSSMIVEALDVLFNEKYPDANEGDRFTATFRIYNGSAGMETVTVEKSGDSFVAAEQPKSIVEIEDTFALAEGEWNMPLELDSSLYQNEFGQRFSNFGDLEEAGYFIGLYLDQLFPYAQSGDYKVVAFRYYNGSSTVTKYGRFEFNNGSFEYLPEVAETKLQFGKEEGEWLPDNTIVYVLASTDYDYVAEQLGAKYPSETANLSQYGNFNTFSWDDAELLEAFNIILVDIVAPNAEVGQKYQLVVSIYNGSTVNANYALIKTEDGSWSYQD